MQDLKREVIINFKLKIDLFPFIVCQLNFTPDAAVPEKQNIFFGLVILALGPQNIDKLTLYLNLTFMKGT